MSTETIYNMQNKKALLVGANGLIGKALLLELLKSDEYANVEIWVRKPLGIANPKLKERIIDFSRISDLGLIEADGVFCCLGTTINKAKTNEAFRIVDYEYVVELAELASKSGCASFFVISSMGANSNSSNFYLRTKGEMEEAVKAQSIKSIYILRPSLLLGKREEYRFGELLAKYLMTILSPLFIFGLKKYKGIKVSTIARAILKLAMTESTGVSILESDKIQEIGKISG
jgi:uncharacterized protein YbjT (DUF2867 family)